MNTPEQNAGDVKPAITAETAPYIIPEVDMVALLTARARQVREKFGTYALVRVQVAYWMPGAEAEVQWEVCADSLESNYTGKTFNEAMSRACVETPEFKAEKKRQAAAKLLAEADALVGGKEVAS